MGRKTGEVATEPYKPGKCQTRNCKRRAAVCVFEPSLNIHEHVCMECYVERERKAGRVKGK